MDRLRIVGERTRRWTIVCGVDKPKLLAFIAAAIRAVNNAVIDGRTPQERDLLIVERQLALVPAVQVHRPHLGQTGTAQMKQRLSVSCEGRRGSGSDFG